MALILPSASSASVKLLRTHLKNSIANTNSGGTSTMLTSVILTFMPSISTSATASISTARNTSTICVCRKRRMVSTSDVQR